MDKNRELAKNTLIITIGKICTQFVSFFLLPLYTFVLSTEEYGVVDLVVTYTSLFIPLILFEVDQAVFRFLVEVRNNVKKTKEILSTAWLFALLQIIISFLIFGIIQYFIGVEYKWYLVINVFGAICLNMVLQCTRGLGFNVLFAFGSFLAAFSQILGNVVFLLIFNMGVKGMLLSTIMSHFIAGTVVFVKISLYKYISIKCFSLSRIKELLKYSIPLVPNQLCWWILNVSDRSIVLLFLGTSFNGLLSVAHKFSAIYITFYNIFNISWTESAALHLEDKDSSQFFSIVISNMFKLFMCVGIGIIAIMPFVFHILINSKFSEAYGTIPIFMLASMLNVVVGLYSVIYVALKKTQEIAKTSIYSAVTNIVIHLVLIRVCGLYAAAISTVIAFLVMALYRYFDLKKYINIKLPVKYVVVILSMYVWTMIGYYSSSVYLQIAILLIDLIIAFRMNKSMLIGGINMVLKKINVR